MRFAPDGHGKRVPGGLRRAGHAWRFSIRSPQGRSDAYETAKV